MADLGAHQNWSPIEGVISDLDGVIYRGKAPILDAVETFNRWQACGLPFCFVTNNSTHTPEDVVRKLAGFGLAVDARNVVTSAITAAELIRANYPEVTRVYMIGAPSLVAAIAAVGLEVTADKGNAGADKNAVGKEMAARRNVRPIQIELQERSA